MAGFTELIRTFGRTRDYVRDFFIYGCKTRGEFTGKSRRSYDDERRRVENWLGGYVDSKDSERGRAFSIIVDSGHIFENPLYQVYYAKSFTDRDMQLYFLLMDFLADGKTYTVPELKGRLLKLDISADDKTVRDKLSEYTAEGLLTAQKQGKTMYYQLSSDTFSGLAEQYPGLTDAVRFFSETQPFGVVGNSILRSADQKNDCFIMKHYYIVHTLEDEILGLILEAMCTKRFLSVRVLPTHSALSGETKESEQRCIPLQIRTSVQTGRRYLIAYQPAFTRFTAYRLDFIREAAPGEQCPDYDAYAEQLRRNLPHVFGVSFGDRRTGEISEPLRMTLRITPEEGFVLERVKRELRTGTLEQTGEDTYCVTLDVFDPREALPWIRTFTGRILSLEGGTEDVRRLFREDTLAMARLYEEDNHDTVP